MHAPPVGLKSCRKVFDCLTRQLSLIIGVMTGRGKLVETVYEVRRGEGGAVELVREDGEIITVEPGGRCTCPDAKYRKRGTGCKHVAACRLAGLLGVSNGSDCRAVG